MNNNRNLYNISNEQLQLISILNNMYNDNIRQINRYTNFINNLNIGNREIRNFIIQILNTNNQPNTNANINTSNRRTNRQTQRNNIFRDDRLTLPSLSSLRGLYIDSINEYVIPFRDTNSENTNFSRILQNFFTPVEVYPTQAQIETATRRIIFSDIEEPRNRTCPISLETFGDDDIVTIIRYCGHIFNTEELNTWFSSHCICPVCRYDIRNNTSSSREFFQELRSRDSSNNSIVNNTENTENTENNRVNRNVSESTPYLLTLVMDIISDNNNTSNISDTSNNYMNTSEVSSLLNIINNFQRNNRQ
jgi:hypothetical protein